MNFISQKYKMIIEKVCSPFSLSAVQVICFILYKIIVDLIYMLYLGKTSDYGVNINVLNVISGYMMVLFFSLWIVRYCNQIRPSSFIMIVFNMIYFIPLTAYCSWGVGSSATLFFGMIYWLWLTFLWNIVPTIRVKKKVEFTQFFFIVLFLCTCILTLYISYRYTGFRIVTSLQHIYEIRAEAATYDLPRLLSYFQQFSSIIIPMLILMAFNKKKYILVIIGFVLLIFNFSFAAQKSILFMGILLLLGYIFWKKEMIYLIIPGGTLLGILGLVEKNYFFHDYIISYLFRRQGYLLVQLSDEYYRFFRNNPTDIFRSTFLGKLGFHSPYNLPISKVIGNNYSSQIINCNNGLLADVWSHLGVIGVLVMPIILIICFRFFDFVCDELDAKYYVGLTVYCGVLFANTTWSTVLLTHGFLIMCVLFFVFPGKEEKNEKLGLFNE